MALYYLVFIKKERYLLPGTVGGIIFIIFVLVPIIIIVLYFQFTASSKLQALGFTPHPNLTSSMGIASGQGDKPIWVFSYSDHDENIIDFYRVQKNSVGWILDHEEANKLVFLKDNKKMNITSDNKTIVFSLSEVNEWLK